MKRPARLLASAAALLAGPGAMADTVTLIERPVLAKQEIGAFDPRQGVAVTTLVGDGDGQYAIPTWLGRDLPLANRNEAVAEARGQVRWTRPYLLVEALANTKMDVYNTVWVFKIVHRQTKLLGLLGGSNLAMRSPGRFLSLYNKAAAWQSGAFSCTACLPDLPIVLRDTGGKLSPDLEATWRIHRTHWRYNEKVILGRFSSGMPADDDRAVQWRLAVMHSLLENAVLAAYCRRSADVGRLTALAEKHLDRDSLKEFERSLSHVVPGEAPEQWSAAWSE